MKHRRNTTNGYRLLITIYFKFNSIIIIIITFFRYIILNTNKIEYRMMIYAQ